MNRLTRRDFLRASALGMGAIVISTGLAGCLSSSSSDSRKTSFRHGVASGDPLRNRVLLWTRVTPEDGKSGAVNVGWEVATDESFSALVHSGTTQAKAEHDYTIKVDVTNLHPGQTYFYRFRAEGDSRSPVGKTCTLPEGSIEQARFAVVSCSNYPAGFFNVYREVANEPDIDAVIHLGDYLYEYDNQGYATDDAEGLGRTMPANNDLELVELVDYRRRYALYRTDADLQAAHASAPFIAVWDDHEIANDTWKNGAENHDDAIHGDFTARKLRALQAYFEWMPIRPAFPDSNEAIYRRFDYGDLVSLYMLDTRIIGRDEQLEYESYLTENSEAPLNIPQFTADMSDPNRTMLGAEQRLWLQASMNFSQATWHALGQQVLMGRMSLPAELLLDIVNRNPTILEKFGELAQIKGRYLAGDPTLEPKDIARVTTVLPYNLDAWDGYFVEREVVLGTARQLNKNLVVLAGDTHNGWASNLKDMNGNEVGVEFATASVSSPGSEEYLNVPEEAVAQAEQAITLLADDLQYANINQRGYMLVTFTATEARADWRYVDTVKSREYSIDTSRNRALKVNAGERTLSEV